jgi:hypothetical protein
MKYSEAENLAATYSGVIGRPLLNKLVFLDDRRITSLLVCSPLKIKEVFSEWWHNGNNNEKAVMRNKKHVNFEVFLMSYIPSTEEVVYYLRLTRYLELEKKP